MLEGTYKMVEYKPNLAVSKAITLTYLYPCTIILNPNTQYFNVKLSKIHKAFNFKNKSNTELYFIGLSSYISMDTKSTERSYCPLTMISVSYLRLFKWNSHLKLSFHKKYIRLESIETNKLSTFRFISKNLKSITNYCSTQIKLRL